MVVDAQASRRRADPSPAAVLDSCTSAGMSSFPESSSPSHITKPSSLRPCAVLLAATVSPRDLHPIKFFITPADALEGGGAPPPRPGSRHGPRGKGRLQAPAEPTPSGRSLAAAEVQGENGPWVCNPLRRELEQLECDDEINLSRSKSDAGGTCDCARPPNPILRELEELEAGYNRSNSVDSPSGVSAGQAWGKQPRSNPILRELQQMDSGDLRPACDSPDLLLNLRRVQPKQGPKHQRMFTRHSSSPLKELETESSDDEDLSSTQDDDDSSSDGSGRDSVFSMPRGIARRRHSTTASQLHKAGGEDVPRKPALPTSRSERQASHYLAHQLSIDAKVAELEQDEQHQHLRRQETVQARRSKVGLLARAGLRSPQLHDWRSMDESETQESEGLPGAGHESPLAGASRSSGARGAIPAFSRFMLSPRRSLDSRESWKARRAGTAGSPLPPGSPRLSAAGSRSDGRKVAQIHGTHKKERQSGSVLQHLDVFDARRLLRRQGSSGAFAGVQMSESCLQPHPSKEEGMGKQFAPEEGFNAPSPLRVSRLGLSSLRQLDLADCRG